MSGSEPGYVLDPLLATRLEAEVNFSLHVVVDRAGYDYFAGLG